MKIEIDKDKYYEMIERLAWLDALEQAGVDNWEGISYAQELMAYPEEEDE